jgi:AcrR family transcriptional regulator
MTKVGDARRAAVVGPSIDIASIDGFEGLSFGRVAEATGMNRSALQTLFGTKEALQLAILKGAVRIWRERVLHPAELHPDGVAQLRALIEAWIDYLPTFAGGCPFVAAASELDGRPGPVRDALLSAIEAGHDVIRRQASLAIRLGELPAQPDADQLTYELHAVLLKANHDLQLFGHTDAPARARAAVSRLLDVWPEASAIPD